MRASFVRTLAGLARDDSRVILLTGDLGFMVVEDFAAEFPHRFINCGVAEQNMLGVATGLAEAGFIPFVYSIATFASMRPYEFIRNGPVLQRLPVRIVAVGGGFEYGSAGPTHYALEDVAIMRAQPSLAVVAPADAEQTRSALLATWQWPGPVYYRLGKQEQYRVPGLDGRFDSRRVEMVRSGKDMLFLTHGSVARETVKAAEQLASSGVSAAVAIVAQLNPAPVEHMAEVLAQYRLALTVEAHYLAGGLGSIVAEVIAGNGLRCRLVRRGVRQLPHGVTGSEDYMNEQAGLSAPSLAAQALAGLAEVPA